MVVTFRDVSTFHSNIPPKLYTIHSIRRQLLLCASVFTITQIAMIR